MPAQVRSEATEPDAETDQTTVEDRHVCDVCGFVAKSAGGLGSHKRVHR